MISEDGRCSLILLSNFVKVVFLLMKPYVEGR